MRNSLRILAIAPFFGAGVAANASSYTDQAAWRAAVSNVYALETFDSLPAASDVTDLPALGLHFLPLDDGTQPTVQPYSYTGGVVQSGPNNLLNDRDNSLPGRGPLSVTPINPGDFLYGLGLFNVGGDDQLRLTFYDAIGNVIEQVDSATSYGFFGIVNDAGAVRATIDFIGGNGYAPTDDWQTAVRTTFIPSDAPEPASWAMFIGGFGLVGGAMRNRRKATITFA